jgi:dTMP kinase
MARYIIFEGIDGCGKTTQIQAVRDRLVAANKDVIRLREPTRDSPFGKKLREIFAAGKRPSPDDEFEMFEEDRRWHMEWHVKHAMMLDAIILQDRGYMSTAAYQSSDRRSIHDIIRSQERFSFIPTAIILLDMDVDDALRRIGTRGEGNTSMEKRDMLIKVRNAFLEIYKDYGKARNIVKIDAGKAPGEVTGDIMAVLEKNGVY